MSYASLAALGQDEWSLTPELSLWRRIAAGIPYIYLWNARVTGIEHDRVGPLREMVKAFGRAVSDQTAYLDPNLFNIKAIIVSPFACPEETSGCAQITFIVTLSSLSFKKPPIIGGRVIESAESMGDRWIGHLQQVGIVNARYSEAGWFQYSDKLANKLIVDHWRSQPDIWDMTLGDKGGATQALAWGMGLFKAAGPQGIWGEYGSQNLTSYPISKPVIEPPDIPPPAEWILSPGLPWLAAFVIAGYGVYELSRRYHQ
jgi:hypothetical protein